MSARYVTPLLIARQERFSFSLDLEKAYKKDFLLLNREWGPDQQEEDVVANSES